MSWLYDRLRDLLRWLYDGFVSCFGWVIDEMVSAATWVYNRFSAFAVGLLATIAGVMPSETLAGVWGNILSSLDWLDGWPCYLLVHAISFPDLLARLTYFGAVAIGCYVARGAFMAVRAVLDII